MDDENLNIDGEKIIKHWVDSSEDDLKTMWTLFNSKSFGWALFIGHISVEKLLKALFVKKFNTHPPFTHNLYRLAEMNGIELTEEYSDWLDKITSFNINARYDDYKKEFYLSCTVDFAKEWLEKIEIIRKWILQMF